MSSEYPKRRLFELFATVGKALAHGHRMELLEYLAQGEHSFENLVACAGLSIVNTSQHLQQLRRTGLVAARKQGKHVQYRVADDAVIDLLAALRRLAERNFAEVDRIMDVYFRERDSFEAISFNELMNRTRNGLVTVLDVRPVEEYRQGHIPGAVNIPLSEPENRLAELDPDREVVAYCRGPYCVLAFEAVARLRQHGLEAHRLEDGFPEWKPAGFPIGVVQSGPHD